MSDEGEEVTMDAVEETVPAEEINPLEAEVVRLKDQLLRTAAEFDNYRKRQKREFDELKAYAGEKVLLTLIPVLDNLDRALSAAPDKKDPVINGVKMVADQFRQSLESHGVKKFEAVGKPFDPARHEAIQEREAADVAPGSVVEEFQSGYMLGERVIRPAMVVVAKKMSEAN